MVQMCKYLIHCWLVFLVFFGPVTNTYHITSSIMPLCHTVWVRKWKTQNKDAINRFQTYQSQKPMPENCSGKKKSSEDPLTIPLSRPKFMWRFSGINPDAETGRETLMATATTKTNTKLDALNLNQSKIQACQLGKPKKEENYSLMPTSGPPPHPRARARS